MAIKIAGDGSPAGTRVIDMDTGVPICGIDRVSFSHRAGEVPRADVGLVFVGIDLASEPDFMTFSMRDPHTDEMKVVKRIEFADGTEFVAA